MNDPIVEAVLGHLITEVQDTGGSVEITLESDLRDELGIDSLQAVNLVVEMEERFDISISEEELEGLKTVGDVVQAIKGKLREKGEG